MGVIYSLSYFYAVISVLPYAYGEWGIGLVVALVAVGREYNFRIYFVFGHFGNVHRNGVAGCFVRLKRGVDLYFLRPYRAFSVHNTDAERVDCS